MRFSSSLSSSSRSSGSSQAKRASLLGVLMARVFSSSRSRMHRVANTVFSSPFPGAAMSVSAAKSRVMQAKMKLESNRVGDAEAAVEAGLKFLEGLPDSETAAVRAELMQIRAGIASRPKPEDARNLSAAQGKVRQAQSQIAGKQLSGIEDVLL